MDLTEEDNFVMKNNDDADSIYSITANTEILRDENTNPGKLSTKELVKKKLKRKKKNIVNKEKKIGPQKQKEVIRNLLKRSRVYEIRKLTRRIELLRSLKGNEIQIEKNKRKVANLLKEIEAMKSIIIEQMAEKLVDVFKGICHDFCKDVWNAASSKSDMEKKLQDLSQQDNNLDDKYKEVAYLKIFSSKDIIKKLKLIESGKNLKKPHKKPRKLKRKPSKKNLVSLSNNFEPATKALSKSKLGEFFKSHTGSSKISNEGIFQKNLVENDLKHNESTELNKKLLPGIQLKEKAKIRTHLDPFFLGKPTVLTDDVDEEFDVEPKNLIGNKEVIKNQHNRMGQRTRKKLQKGKMGVKTFIKSETKYKKNNGYFKESSNKFRNYSQCHKSDDIESLHPSWQAKKKMRLKPVVYAGTKIIFGD